MLRWGLTGLLAAGLAVAGTVQFRLRDTRGAVHTEAEWKPAKAIVAMVLRQAGAVVGAGLAVGLAGSLAFSRALASLLFQVKPTDAGTYARAVALLAAISLAAAAVPARRGASVDPMRALREE